MEAERVTDIVPANGQRVGRLPFPPCDGDNPQHGRPRRGHSPMLEIVRRVSRALMEPMTWRARLKRGLHRWRYRRDFAEMRAFDREFGVDTATELPLIEAGVPVSQIKRGNGLYRT